MDVSAAVATRAIVGIVLAVVPGLLLNLGQGSSLNGNMPADVFWHLSVELQSPQHMLPHLWCMPQWLAWSGYIVLAGLAWTGQSQSAGPLPRAVWDRARSSPSAAAARLRLATVLAVILAGLCAGWYAIEVGHQVRVTVFQPFRMATVLRGIALVFIAGRLVTLWRSGGWLGRMRAIVIAAALTGDWLFVVVTLAETAAAVVEAIRNRQPSEARPGSICAVIFIAVLVPGLSFLGHHDTEYGNRTLVAALGVSVLIGLLAYCRKHFGVSGRGMRRALFPSLAKGGQGGVVLNQSIAGRSKALSPL